MRGGYPELVAHPKRDANLRHASYVQTYRENAEAVKVYLSSEGRYDGRFAGASRNRSSKVVRVSPFPTEEARKVLGSSPIWGGKIQSANVSDFYSTRDPVG